MEKGGHKSWKPLRAPTLHDICEMHSLEGLEVRALTEKNHSCAHHGNLQSLHKLTDSRQEPEREEMAGEELKNREEKRGSQGRREREEATGTRMHGFQLSATLG